MLISTIGEERNVLKVRPPLAFDTAELPILIDALTETLSEV